MALEPLSPELVLVAAAADAADARARLPPPLWERYPPSWRSPPAPAAPRSPLLPRVLPAAALAAAAILLLATHRERVLRPFFGGSETATSPARLAAPPPGAGYVAANGLRFTVGTDGAAITGLAARGCGPAIPLPPIRIRSGRFTLRVRMGVRRVMVEGRFVDGRTALVNVVVTTGSCTRTTSGRARLS